MTKAVKAAHPDLPLSQRDKLTEELLELLEKDTSWLKTYEIAGELNFPTLKDRVSDGKHAETYGAVQQV